jgi:hypothetical protein
MKVLLPLAALLSLALAALVVRETLHFWEVDAWMDAGGLFDDGVVSCDGPAGCRSLVGGRLSVISWTVLVLPAWIAAAASFWCALTVGRRLLKRRRT